MGEISEIEKEEIKRTSENSFQMLMEGRAELFITPADDKVNQCNFSKLLRDLYQKIYQLEAKLTLLSSPNK